jgi:enoyl-CoA hydratase
VSDFKFLEIEDLDGRKVRRITLNRPRYKNAQNRGLIVELDEAFREAEADDEIRVVILRGAGTMFSSGHDIGSPDFNAEWHPGEKQHPTRRINGGQRNGGEQRMLQEWHYFFNNTRRWRSLRKITIAQVHGMVLAAGLMLAWACDLIVASEETLFADVVGTRLGMCGVEYFAHPWEFGPRKAKELLLTGDSIDAIEAHGLGMVSKVFPPESTDEQTLAFARRIAAVPTMTSLLIKESVNQTVDNQGFYNALNACFSLHELNHAFWAEETGGEQISGTPEYGIAPLGGPQPPIRRSVRGQAESSE